MTKNLKIGNRGEWSESDSKWSCQTLKVQTQWRHKYWVKYKTNTVDSSKKIINEY
jgi:hypothetical protein